MNQYSIASHIGVWSKVQATSMERDGEHVDFYVGTTLTATFHNPVSVELIATTAMDTQEMRVLLGMA